MKTSMESVGEGDSYATKSADYTKLLTAAKAHKLALVVTTHASEDSARGAAERHPRGNQGGAQSWHQGEGGAADARL